MRLYYMVMACPYHRTGHPMLLLPTVFGNTLQWQVTFHWSLPQSVTGHFAPCIGDVRSFHRVLANYTSHKHLGTSPNLTRDDQMQRSPATLPSPSESEAFSPYFRNTKFLCFMPKACSSMPDYWHWCLNCTPAEQSLFFILVYILQIIAHRQLTAGQRN